MPERAQHKGWRRGVAMEDIEFGALLLTLVVVLILSLLGVGSP
jgi:hypothetical protein